MITVNVMGRMTDLEIKRYESQIPCSSNCPVTIWLPPLYHPLVKGVCQNRDKALLPCPEFLAVTDVAMNSFHEANMNQLEMAHEFIPSEFLMPQEPCKSHGK